MFQFRALRPWRFYCGFDRVNLHHPTVSSNISDSANCMGPGTAQKDAMLPIASSTPAQQGHSEQPLEPTSDVPA